MVDPFALFNDCDFRKEVVMEIEIPVFSLMDRHSMNEDRDFAQFHAPREVLDIAFVDGMHSLPCGLEGGRSGVARVEKHRFQEETA